MVRLRGIGTMMNQVITLAVLVMAMIFGDLVVHDGQITQQVTRELNRIL